MALISKPGTSLGIVLDGLFDLARRRASSQQSSEQVINQLTSGLPEVKQHKQIVRSIEASIFNLADTYAGAWQLGFAQNILHYLPRELRDMIYKELVLLHNPNENQQVTHRHVNEFHPSAVDTESHFKIRDYPHWFDLSFMGTQFLTELSAKFHFDTKFTLQHPMELKDFLNTDRFGTSCKPHEHVRFLTVEISIDLWNSRSGSINAWSSPKFGTPLKQHFEAALRGLELLKILANNRVTPTILFRVDCSPKNYSEKFAQVLGPLVYELRQSGCILRIDNKYRGQNAFQFDYSMSKKDWKKAIRENSAFIADDPDASAAAKLPHRNWR